MKLGIIGSRTFYDLPRALDVFRRYYCINSWCSIPDTIVTGGARGADRMAELIAAEFKVPLEEYIANWTLGRHAGLLRNKDIIGASDEVLAFWDGKSRGTAYSLKLAKEQKKPTLVIYF